MHPLDPGAVLQASNFVQFILKLLLRDPLQPLLPDHPIILLLLLAVVDDLLAPLLSYRSSIFDAFLDLLLGLRILGLRLLACVLFLSLRSVQVRAMASWMWWSLTSTLLGVKLEAGTLNAKD